MCTRKTLITRLIFYSWYRNFSICWVVRHEELKLAESLQVVFRILSQFTVFDDDYSRPSILRRCRPYLSYDLWNFCLCNRENDNNDCYLFAMVDLCICDYRCRRHHRCRVRNCDTRAIDTTSTRNCLLPLILHYRSEVGAKRSNPSPTDDPAFRVDLRYIYI